MTRILSYSAWGLMFLSALSISLYASAYLNFDPNFGFLINKSKEILSHALYLGPFWIHVMGGIIALSIGPFQFLSKLRQKRMKLHRTLGKVYMIAILIAGISGIPISIMSAGGWVANWGFFLLALAWLFTTGQGYVKIRQKNIEAHRQWMIRSYAVTFAAVTLRIWLGLFMQVLGWDFMIAYPIVAWISWIPNLIAVELWMNWKKSRFNNPALRLRLLKSQGKAK